MVKCVIELTGKNVLVTVLCSVDFLLSFLGRVRSIPEINPTFLFQILKFKS